MHRPRGVTLLMTLCKNSDLLTACVYVCVCEIADAFLLSYLSGHQETPPVEVHSIKAAAVAPAAPPSPPPGARQNLLQGRHTHTHTHIWASIALGTIIVIMDS